MKILVAVDGSEPSEVALHVVKNRPWPPGSQIRVLTVSDTIYYPPTVMTGMGADMGAATYPGMSAASTSMVSANDELLKRANEVAQRAAEQLRSTGFSTEGVGDSGDPRDRIVHHASEWQADLIVVGSHGRTGLKRWLLGSVAESVVRHAPCSVEIARTKESRTD